MRVYKLHKSLGEVRDIKDVCEHLKSNGNQTTIAVYESDAIGLVRASAQCVECGTKMRQQHEGKERSPKGWCYEAHE